MKHFTGLKSKLILFIVTILLVTLACSLSSKPSVSPTISVEDALATLTLMVWTPTAPGTAVPVAESTEAVSLTTTNTPQPTPTTTPYYSWCVGMNTRAAKGDEIKMGPVEGDQGFAAYACLVDVTGRIVGIYPEEAVGLRLGFNDKSGVLHIYDAVVGGLMYGKSKPEAFSYPKCYSSEPPMVSADEFIAELPAYLGDLPKPFPVFINTEFGYKNHPISEASLVNRNSAIHQMLKTAIESGEGFPEVPKNYRLFIYPGLIDCP